MFFPVTGKKAHILYVTCAYSDACLSSTFHAMSIYGEIRVITAVQRLYPWADDYTGAIEMHLLLRKEFDDILAFNTTSLIKVTNKALIIPCCQRAVKIIFNTNTSFISECVSVMIIRALTLRSRFKSILSDCGRSEKLSLHSADLCS